MGMKRVLSYCFSHGKPLIAESSKCRFRATHLFVSNSRTCFSCAWQQQRQQLKSSSGRRSYSWTHRDNPLMASTIKCTEGGLDVDLEIIKVCPPSSKNGMNKAFTSVISSSASCLKKGGVIAVPTDTIYGIACLAQNTEAVNRIYDIKHRNFKNPVAISVGTIDDIYRWSKVTVPKEILMDLLPGPVTVVFERSPELNPALNPHTELVGIRIPNHNFMQSLARECNSPIALTSANISGGSSCLQVEVCCITRISENTGTNEFETLWPRLDLVVNGGTLSETEESRLGSTVVDLSTPGAFRIIRPGSAHQVTQGCLQDKHQLKEIFDTASDR